MASMGTRCVCQKNVAQTDFGQNYYMTFSVLKRSPKYLSTFVIYKKLSIGKRNDHCARATEDIFMTPWSYLKTLFLNVWGILAFCKEGRPDKKAHYF
jgi:hypothetical protein